MLTPIADQPTHYGLTWTGQHDTERFVDTWQARHGDYEYAMADLGYMAILLITHKRTSKEIGHRCASMKAAALMASEHAHATYF